MGHRRIESSWAVVLPAAMIFTFVCTSAAPVSPAYFPPENMAPHCQDPSIQNFSLYYTALEASTQMPAQVGAMRVGIPFETLVAFFNVPQYWPVWNHLFAYNNVTNYSLCANFNAVGYTNPPPVQPPFPNNLTAPHWIDQHGYSINNDAFVFGWIFQLRAGPTQANMIVFGRHTFTIRPYVDQSGVNASTVESFEKAAGPQLDSAVNQVAWTIALQESLADAVAGMQCLELVFVAHGMLTIDLVTGQCGPHGTMAKLTRRRN